MELTESVTAVEGSTVEFRCPVTGDPTPEIAWHKNHAYISDLPGGKVWKCVCLDSYNGVYLGMYVGRYIGDRTVLRPDRLNQF